VIAQDLISAPASQAFVERLLRVWDADSGEKEQNEQISSNESLAESELQ